MLVLLLTLAAGTAFAQDVPEEPPLPARERQAIASVDVMPVVERLHEQLGLSRASTQDLARALTARERALTPDPFDLELRGPDTLIELFAVIAMLRELHRRDALDLRLRGIEASVAFHLAQLGARYLTDPLLDRRIRVWRTREGDPARQGALRDLGISIQAASEIGARWFAESLQTARLADPTSPVLDAQIGLWLIGLGEGDRGVGYLEGLRGILPSDPEVLRALAVGLRSAGRDRAADALRDELRATAPAVYREIVAFERRRADHQAEVAFRVSPRPRPVQAWVDHVQRLLRDPAAAPVDVDQALALAREDHPGDLRLARVGATVLAVRGDVDGLVNLVRVAIDAGAEPDDLRAVQVLAALLAVLRSDGGEVSAAVEELEGAVAAWVASDDAADPALVHGIGLIGAVASAVRSDAAREQRGAVRSARRLARRHKTDVDAIRAAAVALHMLGERDRSFKVLDRGARRLPSIARAQLRLDAVSLGVLGAQVPGLADRLPGLLAQVDQAAALGARPEEVRLLRARLALLQAIGDGGEVSRDALRAPTAELDLAALRLGARAGDEVRIAEARRALCAAYLLIDDTAASLDALAASRRGQPDHPLAELSLAVHATLGRAPNAAIDHLERAGPLGSSSRGAFAIARWRLTACEQRGDAACAADAARALDEVWDDVGAPASIGVWAAPYIGGDLRLGAGLSLDGSLAWDLVIAPEIAPLVLLPHDRSAVRAAAGRED